MSDSGIGNKYNDRYKQQPLQLSFVNIDSGIGNKIEQEFLINLHSKHMRKLVIIVSFTFMNI